jgi:DNA polymerase/3'-5' exonuclease PolX
MKKKQSYMNKSNIINEGIIDKIFDYIKQGKIKRLQKAFRKHPEVQKRIERINKEGEEIAKWYKKEFGRDVPKDFFI